MEVFAMITMNRRSRSRPALAAMSLLVATALLVCAAPLAAFGADVEYRAALAGYHEEGFGLVETFLPYTEYRAMVAGYHEEGFGFLR